MKFIDKILYLDFKDLLSAGWKEDTIKKANFRNGPNWMMIPNPTDKRMPLVQYDTLRLKDKERIIALFGDPYEYVAKQPIKQLVQPDPIAEKFYVDYRYAENKFLPADHRNRYTTAAAWLNMLIKVNADKKFIKNELKLSLDQFWTAVLDIIRIDAIELPITYRPLLAKMKAYKENGYSCLIDWRFGNKNTAKLGKTEDGFDPQLREKQLAFIRKAASMPNNFDAMQITNGVNAVFEKQGWPIVSSATVYNLMNENRHLTLAGSRGKRAYNNEISMQTKRSRPVFPLYYFTLDGWTVELLYQENGKFHHRLTMVVVLDAMNNYPIGYAIGDREDTELIRQANRNAALHIKELFGDNYQPWQLQSDNYGIKNLTPFYGAMAHLHTPAAVGNAKAKVIEPYFSYLNKNYCQYLPNWSGFNLNSKKSNQPNTEFLDKTKHNLPNKAAVIMQIESMMMAERKSKIQAYMQAWENTPADKKLVMNKMDMLMVHGRPSKHLNSIDGMGLTITLGGNRITFDSFDPSFRALQHLKWQVIYDEQDMSHVIVENYDVNKKFLLERKRVLPIDIQSMKPEDHQYRSQITQFNNDRRDEVMQKYLEDDNAVAAVLSNTEMLENETHTKLMFTYKGQQKEKLQDAKGLKQHIENIESETTDLQVNWQQKREEYLNSKTDFSQYLD